MNDSERLEPADDDLDDDLRPEYDLDDFFLHSQRGAYAKPYAAGTNLVVVDAGIMQAFPDARAVNAALRLLLEATRLARPAP
ncbi:MAG: hypothetical protein ACR2NO_07450 [Chloroflexota bacterium]